MLDKHLIAMLHGRPTWARTLKPLQIRDIFICKTTIRTQVKYAGFADTEKLQMLLRKTEPGYPERLKSPIKDLFIYLGWVGGN